MKDQVPKWAIAILLALCGWLLNQGFTSIDHRLSQLETQQSIILQDVGKVKGNLGIK